MQSRVLACVEAARCLPDEAGVVFRLRSLLRIAEPVRVDDLELVAFAFVRLLLERLEPRRAFQAVQRRVPRNGEQPALEAGAL